MLGRRSFIARGIASMALLAARSSGSDGTTTTDGNAAAVGDVITQTKQEKRAPWEASA